MKSYDWSKAQAVVDCYLTALETVHPLRLGRPWLEIQMAKVGLVSDWRDWEFMESHAAWYACLILTRSIGRVTRRESELQTHPSKTAATIRALRFGRLRGNHASRLLGELLAKAKAK